jgi:hypothetical protein
MKKVSTVAPKFEQKNLSAEVNHRAGSGHDSEGHESAANGARLFGMDEHTKRVTRDWRLSSKTFWVNLLVLR